MKKRYSGLLLLIRMFTVGATIGRPQTTAKPKRATNGRPYKRISAEMLFSLPICVIMGYIVGRGLAPAVMNALNLKCGGSKPPPYKGVWALPCAGIACNAVIQRRNWR
jgi:hypothetical protein